MQRYYAAIMQHRNTYNAPTEKDIERFWSKVDKGGDCWLWTAATFSTGYGAFYYGGRNHHASRVSFEIANGPITGSGYVCHTCDVRSCVRPSHLYLGTAADNARDAVERKRYRTGTDHPSGARTHCPRGHEYTPENTYRRKDRNGRMCRTCMKLSSQVQNGIRYSMDEP